MSLPEKSAYWFPAKTYGWGWGFPQRWQGWVVIAVYAAAAAVGSVWLVHRFPGGEHKPYAIAYLGALSLVLLAICWWKGEPPRWRRGSSKQSHE